MYELTMGSDEYGTELFTYDSLEDALAGMLRHNRKTVEMDDGIQRNFKLQKKSQEE